MNKKNGGFYAAVHIKTDLDRQVEPTKQFNNSSIRQFNYLSGCQSELVEDGELKRLV